MLVSVKEGYDPPYELMSKETKPCEHKPVQELIKPDMGSFPSSFTCTECQSSVEVTWYPRINTENEVVTDRHGSDAESKECCFHEKLPDLKDGEMPLHSVPCTCSCHKEEKPDYYTKKEIDESFGRFFDRHEAEEKKFRTELLELLSCCVSNLDYDDLDSLKKKYL